MPGRSRQRSTFEKRQRELSRREKQAEKRARRQGKVIEPVADEPERGEPLSAEEAFRQSLLGSQGSFGVFLSNPLVSTIMILGLIALFWSIIQEGYTRLRSAVA